MNLVIILTGPPGNSKLGGQGNTKETSLLLIIKKLQSILFQPELQKIALTHPLVNIHKIKIGFKTRVKNNMEHSSNKKGLSHNIILVLTIFHLYPNSAA